VLRHRLVPGYAAAAAQVSVDAMVRRILDSVPAP
jgi:hypothetical protein